MNVSIWACGSERPRFRVTSETWLPPRLSPGADLRDPSFGIVRVTVHQHQVRTESRRITAGGPHEIPRLLERPDGPLRLPGIDEAIAETGGAFEGGRRQASEPDRNPAFGQGQEPGPIDLVVAPRIAQHRLVPETSEQLDLLLLPLSTIAEIFVQGLVLDIVPADTDAEPKSSTGEDVDLCGLLRDEGRLTLGKDQHAGGELDPGGDARQEAEEDEELVEGRFLGIGAHQLGLAVVGGAEDVVVGEEVVETAGLHGLGQVADDGRIPPDFGLGKDGTELHGCSPLVALRPTVGGPGRVA